MDRFFLPQTHSRKGDIMQSIEEIKKGLEAKTLRENESIEFKASMHKDTVSIAKHCVGIANSGGGYYIVGVTEIHDELQFSGVKKEDKFYAVELLEKMCYKYTINIKCKVDIEHVHNVDILVVAISCLGATAYFKDIKPIAYFRDSLGRLSSYRYRTIYKYMPFDIFISNLYKGVWFFSEPTKWNDKFESLFYCANFSPDKSKQASKIYATCLTRKQNNEAAWKVYAHGPGLGAHCVQLELDVDCLREEFENSSSKYDFSERKVDYKSEYYIMNLHRKHDIEYQKYFNPFSLNTFISLLSLKRDAYEYEDEVRMFAIPKGAPLDRSIHDTGDSIPLPITWKKVIKHVRVDKACTEAEFISIQQACFHADINPVFKNSPYPNLFSELVSSSNYTNIEFELYNVNDIPKGTRRITIM